MANLNKTQREYLLRELGEKKHEAISNMLLLKKNEPLNIEHLSSVRVIAGIRDGLIFLHPNAVKNESSCYNFKSSLTCVENLEVEAFNKTINKAVEALRNRVDAEIKKVERRLVFAEAVGANDIIENFSKMLNSLVKASK
jgi:hypothetical protein